MEVQAELDRVATFKGGHINSSVLHGSQQRFTIKVRSCGKCHRHAARKGVKLTLQVVVCLLFPRGTFDGYKKCCDCFCTRHVQGRAMSTVPIPTSK